MKMKKKFLEKERIGRNFKREIIGLGIVLSFGIVSLTWFRGHPFLWGGDTSIPLSLKIIDEYFYVLPLNFAYGMADVAKLPFLLPLGSFLKLWGLLNLPYSAPIFEKLLIYAVFTFSGVSMYFLLTVIRPKITLFAKLLGSLLYMFNFYFLWLLIDVSRIPIIYSFFPLVLALYIKGVKEGKGLSYSVITALVWTITVTPGYGQPFVVINWFVILLFLIFYVITTHDKERTKKALYFTLYLAVIWLALNALWILPLSLSFNQELVRHTLPDVSSWTLFEKNSVSVLDGFRFMGLYSLPAVHQGSPFFPWYSIYDSPLFIVISFLIPILAFLAFVIDKKDKNLIYFGILTIIFLFLVKGPNSPWGSINTFLFSGFNLDFIFRSTYQRFMGYVVLGSTVLIAFTVDKLTRLKTTKKSLKILKVTLFIVFFVSLVGILPHPLWTGSLYDQSGVNPSRRVEIPRYYYETAEWIDNQQGDFNVTPLPFLTMCRGVFSWENGANGYRGTYPFVFLSSKRFIINDFGPQIGSTLARLTINGEVTDSSIFNVLNIKYIFFHRDTNWGYIEGDSEWISGTPEQIQKSLNSIAGLVLEKSFGEIDIYRNTYWKPTHAYLLPETLSENLISNYTLVENLIKDGEVVELNEINPTLYRARIETEQPFILIFNESYDKGWTMNVNGKEYEPFNAFGFTNGYQIYEKGNLEITLEYKPQRWFYCGAIVSLVSFVGCFGYLIYSKRTRIKSFLKEIKYLTFCSVKGAMRRLFLKPDKNCLEER